MEPRPNLEDARLVERLLAKEPHAEAVFVERYFDDLYRFLRHLTRHAQESEDLAQQTLLRAVRNLGSFDGRSSLRTWLHRIAYREFLNWRRGRRLWVALNPHHRSHDRAFDQAEDKEVLIACIAKLTPTLAATFLLVEVQELTLEEAARVLDAPIGTIKSRVHEARAKLRQLLGSTYGDIQHAQEVFEH